MYEANLRDSEKRLRDITSTLGEGVYVVDSEGRVTFMNPEAGRLLGWSEPEVLGRTLHDVIHSRQKDGSAFAEAPPELQTLRSGSGCRVATDGFSICARFPSVRAGNSTAGRAGFGADSTV